MKWSGSSTIGPYARSSCCVLLQAQSSLQMHVAAVQNDFSTSSGKESGFSSKHVFKEQANKGQQAERQEAVEASPQKGRQRAESFETAAPHQSRPQPAMPSRHLTDAATTDVPDQSQSQLALPTAVKVDPGVTADSKLASSQSAASHTHAASAEPWNNFCSQSSSNITEQQQTRVSCEPDINGMKHPCDAAQEQGLASGGSGHAAAEEGASPGAGTSHDTETHAAEAVSSAAAAASGREAQLESRVQQLTQRLTAAEQTAGHQKHLHSQLQQLKSDKSALQSELLSVPNNSGCSAAHKQHADHTAVAFLKADGFRHSRQ